MPSAPLNADATRGRHFKAIVGGGFFLISVAALGVAGVTYGASRSEPAIMAGLPAAVLLVGLVIAFFVADHRAESEFFSAYAARRGLTHHPESSLMEFTPLLGAGDRRKCEHFMDGEFRGMHCRLTLYMYEIERETRNSQGTAPKGWEPHHFTICVVDMEAGLRAFPGFFLRKRRGLFEKLQDDEWLSGRGFPRVELESIAFNKRYELFRDRAMDENALRQLFSPTLVAWLAEHPLAPGVEFKTGTLVVFLEGHVEEAGKLDWLLEATVELSGRVAREVSEASHRPGV
jgi:hypothetical protein